MKSDEQTASGGPTATAAATVTASRSPGEADADAAAGDVIRVRGARTHNLKNLDVDIPRDCLVVITGPSGSGKSSLAFDTLYAEGQRQYVESLSVYARQFLDQMERPDVDLIDGLQPTISIEQRPGSHNPRSTVATVTEVYDYLRLLYARVGDAFCYQCAAPIAQQTPEEIQTSLAEMPEGTKAMILAPLVRSRKGEHREVFDSIRKAGFVRARVDGKTYELEDVPPLSPRKTHDIEAVVDRIIVREGIESRLAESIRLAIKHSEGLVLVSSLDASTREWSDRLFSTFHACPTCKISFEALEPRSFSFNSPYGACPTCQGLGMRLEFDPELVLPDLDLSLAAGAIAPWRGATTAVARKQKEQLEGFLAAAKLDWDAPLARLKPKMLERFLHGDGSEGDEKQTDMKKFLGLLTLLEKEYVTATRAAKRERLEAFRAMVPCADCQGARLRKESLACQVGGRAINEVVALSVSDAGEFFKGLEWDEHQLPIAEPITNEIARRLVFLEKVGVEYLTLDRPADTLSGGEMQRVRLATGIGSGLVGVCYLLDEPSIGLHPRDNQRLIDALRDLQQQGNTVVVVEHDEAMMRQADHLIDMGPAAGEHGGQIVAQGPPDEVCRQADSVTAQYLTRERTIALPSERRRTAKSRSLALEGAQTNNLKDVDVRFPLSALVCVTGVSGSGKSSLVGETLARAIARRLGQLGPKPGPHRSLRGVSQIDRLVQVDQSPIGRTPRSNPATYTGLFDEIRKVFTGTKQARQRGYKAGRFSFNVKGGRCDVCQGQGLQKIEMNFLADLYVTCPECRGARFNRQTLQVRYRGRSIADVLDMSVDDAAGLFENFSNIHRMLTSLSEVGLGYVSLGQPSTTLSGGEAQRIKLATELGRPSTGATFYILDEPTTGLHFDDIRQLLSVLSRLVDLGNTVLVIEHNLEVIKTADWIIDLGPEGGAAGGQIVATGTPEEIAATAGNHTGTFLYPLLNGDS